MYILDTANIEEIKNAIKFYEIDGVTTNPSIIVREKLPTYFTHLKNIKDVLKEKRLYVQVTATTVEKMKEEARKLIDILGKDISIKIPATKDGFQLMKHLRGQVHITATAICSFELGLMSISCGANSLALYVNRMANEGLDPSVITNDLRVMIDRSDKEVTLIGASFKNAIQIRENLLAGAHSVTIPYALLEESMNASILTYSVERFTDDFQAQYRVDDATKLEK